MNDKTKVKKKISIKKIAGLMGVMCLLLLLKQDQSQKNPATDSDDS